ncbi:MAG TPA: response regulator [Acidobacteriota bacterium]|nr:response regulator [Acidobacteriota bacterium]
MSLVGNLEDLPLADILQIVSLSKRTGILTIETEEGKNIVVFKNGLIVSAACPSPKIKNLGQILLERKLINQGRLQELLETQKSRGNEPLGSIVLETGILDKENLQQIIKTQIRATIYHLMNMSEGNFSFDLSEIIPFDDIRYNPLEMMLERGLNPQQILLDSARISDEEKRDEEGGEAAPHDFQAELAELDIEPITQIEEVAQYAEMQRTQDSSLELEAVKLEDLQLPETVELPDIDFTQIANQIDFAPAGTSQVVPQAIPITPIAPPSPPRQAVLLVEDEALIRQIMARRLTERGFEVYQTDNPADAVRIAGELIARREMPWIISDLVMPTSVGNGFLGGLEIVEEVRRLNSSVPIIVMTDFNDAKAQTRAFSLGVQHFHKKPVLNRATIRDCESILSNFSDQIVDTFKLPPHQFKPQELQEEFWGDLGLDKTAEETALSATNMVRQMAALREIIQQLRNPNEAPEISLLILRYAAEFFDRGLLFMVKKEEVDGLGGFGDTGEVESMPVKVRRIRIALAEESIFSRVVKRKQTHIGKLADTPTNRRFIAMTGRLIPTQIAMLPLISNNDVIALLYGDNALTKRTIKDLEGLEIFMVQAGIAMENALLHRKIKTLKFR